MKRKYLYNFMIGHKGIVASFCSLLMGGQLQCDQNIQAALWRGPRGEGPRPPSNPTGVLFEVYSLPSQAFI